MKKQKFMLLILFFLLICNLITSVEKKVFSTGYNWEDWDRSLKLGYVMGLQHGSFVEGHEWVVYLEENEFIKEEEMMEIITSMSEISEIWLVGATYGQMINGVNELYKDYANKTIPVYVLAALTCRRTRGELSDAEMENELQKQRAKVSKEN